MRKRRNQYKQQILKQKGRKKKPAQNYSKKINYPRRITLENDRKIADKDED